MTPAHPGDRSGVVIVGSVTADVTTFSQRLPARGETILGDEFTLMLGGKGANQAVAAGRSGARTSFVGCVGDDLFHDLVVDGLTAAGVDLAHLRTVPGPTGIAHIRVDASAQNDIVMVPLANAALSTEQIDEALAALAPTTSVLLTQLETPSALTAHITARGREHGMTVILDPAPAAELAAEIWRSIDIVTPNETEASLISGIQVTDAASAERAGHWFLEQGVGAAVITLAGQGSCVVTAEGATVVPPFPVEAVDTTAAGDAYAGYLGAALASGAALTDAVRLATAAGALTVTKQGASPSLPHRADVEAFLAARTAAPVAN
ncbi:MULTISPECIES: ribokinase [Microbacterium]|uniref:ribokinase n=2 Tax=Microbacteriaceae TaxID=85023 RepID=UPI0021A70E30|nr:MULTISPECIES: ribokinase [unclassified Microbacterium]MCT1365463.1 ribokinase [Microbacterium sp. p3-SID131]MCT1376210.1 ribokinase [Microbacterium sp. p3-SID337]MDH5132426.1 ribokinase [Microbacterium sp. RD10]MDH5137048.1 ribokinase [Microbacterium sp. RD11]MDH5154354.1 ribokinase [Microbacterium sp. RD06]